MANTMFLLVAALLLTGLAATPCEAYPFGRFPIPARFRGRRGWLRGRYTAPATPATPPHQCTCVPSTPASTATGGARSRSADMPDRRVDCVTPLAGVMMYCSEFLTGSADTPVPGSDCCYGMAAFVQESTVADGGSGGDRTLTCICPLIRGAVNELMVKQFDPVRILYLPTACGVVVKPLIPLCLNETSSP